MSIYDEKPWLNFYDEGMEAEIVVPDASYIDLFLETAEKYPDKPAIHFMGVTLPYRGLNDLSTRFAAYLESCGCGPGDTVGINLPNIPQYLIALVGALRRGCAVTGISPLLTPSEMAYQINDSNTKFLVTLDAIFEHRLRAVAGDVPHLKHVAGASIGDYLPAIKRILGKLLKKIPTGKLDPLPSMEVIPFKKIMSISEPDISPVSIDPEDTCLLQYTGGTTGLPKGTILTHRNLVVNIHQVLGWLNMEAGEEVMCSAFPLFHLAGLMVGMSSLAKNIPQCLIPDPRNTKHICGEIEKYQPTLMTNVPSLYQILMEEPKFKTLDFSRCKLCVSGAAPFAVESIEAFESIVGKGKVLEVYGMTETSPILTMNPARGIKKIGSVGIPVQSTRIKLVDIETGTREVPVGEEGELIAHGPQVMKGYLNKPEETAHALRDFQGEKWLYTGDVANMDADGFFSIADRVKDMLIVGGYKVFSREVEEKLYQLPDVEFCAVVGVPNADRPGNDIVKLVIQRSTQAQDKDPEVFKEEIAAFCKEKMAPYKIPKIIEFIDAIPLTAVGKVDKKALR
ncbi:MAG: AMP-binding protein [Desulfobacterales bacterium]|nr:AMP-binding protein [Desulfobacterales bacterium]MDX2512628.1 AMP-binding protein [Desulfobacterales bacterium]